MPRSSSGDRFPGYNSDPFKEQGQSSFGSADSPVATSDDDSASLIGLFKRLLTFKLPNITTSKKLDCEVETIGQKTDVPATGDTSDASAIALLKRLLQRLTFLLPQVNNRLAVDAEIPGVGDPTDTVAGSDTADSSVISLLKRVLVRLTTLLPQSVNNKLDIDSFVLGQRDDTPAVDDSSSASAIALLKRILIRMGELLPGGNMAKSLISGSAQLTTTADFEVIASLGVGNSIYIDKVILSNASMTTTLVEIKNSTDTLLTLLSPPESNEVFDFSDSAIVIGDGQAVTAANLTSTTTYINLSGYSDALGTTPQQLIQLDWVSDGDDNGVLYYRGTSNNTTVWSNPNDGGEVTFSSSTGIGNISVLCDRTDSSNAAFYTSNLPNQSVTVDLNLYQLICNRYTLQNTDAYITEDWEFQGSNDNATWTTLDTVTGNPATPYAWVNRTISNTSNWRYFRILMSGLDSNGSEYLIFSEIELYGTLSLI